MSLYYPPLEEEQTTAIWKMNIEQIRKVEEQRRKQTGDPPLYIDNNEILKFAKKHFKKFSHGKGRWNGRQIRNAFQIALSLAYHDMRAEYMERLERDPYARIGTPRLTKRHFKIVATATLEFDSYMADTAGKNDAELAYERRDRFDRFQSQKQKYPTSSSQSLSVYSKEDDIYADKPQRVVRHAQDTLYLRQAINLNGQEGGRSPTIHMSYETPPPRQATVLNPKFSHSMANDVQTRRAFIGSELADEMDDL
ncbi:MAG: hypothetical protein M1834_009556 [Cirrosporium novae-zelandiae]|nr:MAG: hypothetical protein M1834_009556 [Cirrosporium novae-zelandiae]